MSDPENAELLSGRASPEGCERFRTRISHVPEHFRRPDGLAISSIGLGMRQGQPGGVDDLLYRSAVDSCLELGINLFNTALSDRAQTSERALGTALKRAFREGKAARDEVVVVTKGGYLVHDPDFVRTQTELRRYLQHTYVDPGLIDPALVVNGHSIQPAFVRDQIERSRRNLGLATIDFYLVQEPELHLQPLGATAFWKSMRELFAKLEDAVREGLIGAYGLCTWDGLLVPHSQRFHLSLVDVFEAALDAGTGVHNLRAIQLPYGLAMGEGVALDSQLGPEGRVAAVLDTLRDTGTVVMTSAPLLGGQILGRLPDVVRDAYPEAKSDAQRCIQFARSSRNVTSVIVGMRQLEHVEHNLALTQVPPANPAIADRLFQSAPHL